MKVFEESNEQREARERMVKEQIEQRGIHNQAVLSAMRAVPRHIFVPSDQAEDAYEDCPLPIGHGQTISQPYIVALMTTLLQPQPGQRILEVGTGSGYQAAVLSQIVAEVYTLEYLVDLVADSQQIFTQLALENIHLIQADGSLGWPQAAPFDGIIITAAAPSIPQPLLDQLSDEGRLVGPVGSRFRQVLQVWERHGSHFEEDDTIAVAFVPLRGEYGWGKDDW